MIIKSLLDIDFYKLTMCQFAWKHYSDVKIEYKFFNRNLNIKLGEIINIDVLKMEIENVRKLKFQEDELDYISSLNIFENDFIDFLKDLELPPVNIEKNDKNNLNITTVGYWKEAILWETIILSLINELYYISKYQDLYKLIEAGTNKNFIKYKELSESDILFADFGTRRRFSSQWQKDVVGIMKSLKGFVGTSNVKLAKDLNLDPIGTNAHELYMIIAGLNVDDLRGSWKKVLNMWYDMYGEDLSVVLTDTWGSEQFFNDFDLELAKKWKGVRHDSGDPFIFGDKVIEFYKEKDIEPKEKTIIFSDGLNLEMIKKLEEYFKGRINIAYGWGTGLTNDMNGDTLSIVMKAFKVISNGDKLINNYLVKLSDDNGKHMGRKEDIEFYKKEFGYKILN